MPSVNFVKIGLRVEAGGKVSDGARMSRRVFLGAKVRQLRRESGIESEQKMTPEMIEVCAGLDIGTISDGYMEMVDYRLGDEPYLCSTRHLPPSLAGDGQ